MKISKLLLAACCLLLTVSACKKDKSKSFRDMVTEGHWQISDIHQLVLVDTAVIFEVTYEDMEACAKDDFLIFDPSGVLIFDQGADKCEPREPQTENQGSWSLSSDGKTLTFDPDSTFSKQYVVQHLNSESALITHYNTSFDSFFNAMLTSIDTIAVRNIR